VVCEISTCGAMRNMPDMQESCGGVVVSGVEKPLYICERCQGAPTLDECQFLAGRSIGQGNVSTFSVDPSQGSIGHYFE
jgi:hypothetical protein